MIDRSASQKMYQTAEQEQNNAMYGALTMFDRLPYRHITDVTLPIIIGHRYTTTKDAPVPVLFEDIKV